MNQDTIVQASAQLSSASGIRLWLGVGLTGLVVLFLTFDGIAKVMRAAPVLDTVVYDLSATFTANRGRPGSTVYDLSTVQQP